MSAFTGLWHACKEGNLTKVKCLVESGVDIHDYFEYPLRISASHKNLQVVKYLVEQGADIEVAYRNAVHFDQTEAVQCLFKIKLLQKLKEV